MSAKIESMQPDARDPGMVRLRVSGETLGPLRREDAERMGLEPGARWTKALERAVHALISETLCRADALRRLGRRDMTQAMLAERLSARWGEATAERVAAGLASDGWIDDRAYAERRAETLQRRAPMPEEAVRERLEAEGVRRSTAGAAAREAHDPKALRVAVRAWANKGRGATWIARALGRQGFDADTIADALHRAGLPCPTDD